MLLKARIAASLYPNQQGHGLSSRHGGVQGHHCQHGMRSKRALKGSAPHSDCVLNCVTLNTKSRSSRASP